MTLIFSNENRILFNVKKTDRAIELNYGNRFTRLLDSKNSYNITTTILKNRSNFRTKTKNYNETTQKNVYKGGYERIDLNKKSEQALFKFVKTTKTECLALQTFSRTEIFSLYGLLFGQTVLTQNLLKDCFKNTRLKRAFNSKTIIKKRKFYTASKTTCIFSMLATFSFLTFLKVRFSFFLNEKKCSINYESQNKEIKTNLKYTNSVYLGGIQSQALYTAHHSTPYTVRVSRTPSYNPIGYKQEEACPFLPRRAVPLRDKKGHCKKGQEGAIRATARQGQKPTTTFFITDPISFLKQNIVFATKKGKRFVFHKIKTTIWSFAFGSSFLLLSMATTLQRQNENCWLSPFLKRQVAGLSQSSQESSWESFENITQKYINRDSTPLALRAYTDLSETDKKGKKNVSKKGQIFLPCRFIENRTKRKVQTLIKNVNFCKNEFYIDFSESWNQQHVQNFAAIFSKPRFSGKNTRFHSLKTNRIRKKWKRKRFAVGGKWVRHQETLFLVQPAHVLNARIPPKKVISKKPFVTVTPNFFGLSRTILQMKRRMALAKIEQYKKRVSFENDSIPSKMASSIVEKKRKHFVCSQNEIVKQFFYKYGVFSIATQALPTSSQESLVTELPALGLHTECVPPAPAPLLSPTCRGFFEQKSTQHGKNNDSFYDFSSLLKDVAQLEKLTNLKKFQKKVVTKLNDRRSVFSPKEKFYTIENRLPIERIANHSFYKQNKINHRFMSGYQIPEIKTLQLTSKPSKKQLFNLFKQKTFFCNNFTFFSRFQFSLPLFASSSSSLLGMSKVCIKVPPALPFYESKTQNLVKTLFYSAEPFFQPISIYARASHLPPFTRLKQDPTNNFTKIRKEEGSGFRFLFSNYPQLRAPSYNLAGCKQSNKQNVKFCFLNQTDQTNKIQTNYLIKPLKKMPYREMSLKSFQEIKPLFEQVNREARISPYKFRFKKSLFLDYKDYLSWKKDTPAAISISPSLEEDEAIETSWNEDFEIETQSKQKVNSPSLPFDEVKKDLQQKLAHGKGRKDAETHVDQNVFDFGDAIDSETPFTKNTLNEASQETQTTIGEEEEKKKEITKLEWLVSVREAEEPVEARKDFQKLAYPSKKALFSKNLTVEQGKLENLLVKDRKDSFFGITNLFPKRLVAQDQKQINYQILQDEYDRRKTSFFDLLKLKKPDFDRFSSYFLQKNKNRVFVEDILEIGLLNKLQNQANQTFDTQEKSFLKTREDLYRFNKSNVSINAPVAPFVPTAKEGVGHVIVSLRETNQTKESLEKRVAPRNRETQTKSFSCFASRQHPVYTPNRRLRLRASESLLSSQNNSPQSRIDDLNLSQSHRWWQKRRTTSSLLGAPSKRYLVMPEITTQDWRNIIEWQLKTYFLEEEKRLQLLVLERVENKKTDLSQSKEKNLLASSPLCTVSIKDRDTDAKNFFKVKKIAIYLPWTTLKKSVKKPFEWPLTNLSYQSLKKDKPQENYPVQKFTLTLGSLQSEALYATRLFGAEGFAEAKPLNSSRKIPLLSTRSLKRDVPKKIATGSVNKKTDFCFVSSISPQFKAASPPFTMQSKTFYSNVHKRQLEKSNVYKPFLFEPVTNNSYLLLHQLLLAVAIKDFFKSIYKVFGKVVFDRIKNSSLAIRFLPIFSNATSSSKKFNLFYPLKKRFKDLVGSEDTISSLSEIVWYLRNSCRGRMVPHGVVLVETVSSETSDFLKAIGGEAQVPVIVQSLRALPFTQNHPQRDLENILTFAQKRRPCILFLDDLDSIGQSRTLLLKNDRSLKNHFYDDKTTSLPNSSLLLNDLTSHGENVSTIGTFEKKKWKKLKNDFKQENFGAEQNLKFNFKSKQGKENDQSLFSSLVNKKSISQVSHNLLFNNFFLSNKSEKNNAHSQFAPSSFFNKSLSASTRQEGRGTFATKKNLESPLFQNEDFSNSENLTAFVTKSNKRLNETEKIVDQRRIDLMLRLLTVMDGISHLNGVVIVTTSKNPSLLDPALLRPGRFERLINLKLPNKKRRIELLKIELSKIGHTNPMPWSYFGTRTQDMTGTEIASAINHSAFRAIIQSTVHTTTTLEYGISCVNGETVTSSSFEKFTKHLPCFEKSKKREVVSSLSYKAKARTCSSLFLDYFQNKALCRTRFCLRKNCNESFFREKSGLNQNVELIQVPEQIVNSNKFQNTKNKKHLKAIVVHNPYQLCSEISFKKIFSVKEGFGNNKRSFPVCSIRARARTQPQPRFLKEKNNLKAMHHVPFWQAGKAMTNFGLASRAHIFGERASKSDQLRAQRANSCIVLELQRKRQQTNARDLSLLFKTPYSGSPAASFRVNKKTRDNVKVSTKKHTRKKNNLYNAHSYNLTQTDLSQNTIRLYGGQASKLLYLDSIPRFLVAKQPALSGKKKRLLNKNCVQNEKSLYKKKRFYTFFEQYLFLQSNVSHKERLNTTLFIDLILNNFEVYKKSQALYPTPKRYAVPGLASKVLPCCFAARRIFKPFKSKKCRKSTRFSFFNKSGFKKKICYQDLRKYLLFNQTIEPDCFVSFSNKTYKDFWWGGKVVETLKTLKQPLGNWYRLYLPRLEQNKTNREWLFPDKIFNQHISLLDLNRLMHHVPTLSVKGQIAVIPSFTFLQMPVQTQFLIFDRFLKNNSSVLFAKRIKKGFEPSRYKKASFPLVSRRETITCPTPSFAVSTKGATGVFKNSMVTQKMQKRSITRFSLPLFQANKKDEELQNVKKNRFLGRQDKTSFGTKVENFQSICNSCQKPCSLQKEKTNRFSYYNMVLSCFYVAFQNCAENRELLDLLADHLVRFKLLRLHEIMRISSFYFY